MLPLRAALFTVALVAVGWFALGVRSVHEENSVQTLVNTDHLTHAQARVAMSELAEAAVLNPDEQVNILRSEAAFLAPHSTGAISIAEGIVRREPRNTDAWLVLDVVAARRDPSLLRLSRAKLAELAPPVRPAP